jgi:hypothetical protein
MVLRQERRSAHAAFVLDVAAARGDVKSRTLHAGFIGKSMTESQYNVAVLVPCYNEARAIAKAVADFRAALPNATLYVYDNNSTDGTVEAAQQAGAVVRRETYQGKGHVVRRMFNDIAYLALRAPGEERRRS